MQAHSNDVTNDVRVRLPEEQFLFWTGLWKPEQVYERELEVIEWL